MQPLTGPYVYGVNRRSENFLLLSDLIFVQYAKNLGGKSRKNLVEHQIIKMIRKFNSIICFVFSHLTVW